VSTDATPPSDYSVEHDANGYRIISDGKVVHTGTGTADPATNYQRGLQWIANTINARVAKEETDR